MNRPDKPFSLASIIILVGMALIPFLSQHIAVAQNSTEQQAVKLQDFYAGLVSLSFDFSQATHTGGRERLGHGNAIFFKPQKQHDTTEPGNRQSTPGSFMRWNYDAPDPQVIISDGTTLSIYTEKDKQMIKAPADELEADITYAFFAGSKNMLDDFQALPADGRFAYSSPQQLQAIRLVPRHPHNQIKMVQLWFDQQLLIHHLIIEDPFDSVTELTFTKIKVDRSAPGDEELLKERFSFSPPAGTEIISR